MISDKMANALNAQLKTEAQASFLYLSMASWCHARSMDGCTNFLMRQSNEERAHMMKLFDYLTTVDRQPLVPPIEKPESEFNSIEEIFQDVYEHEIQVTKNIHDIVDLCYTEKDYGTLQVMQWYIREQIEEEDLMRTVLDKIELIGDGDHKNYYIDREIRHLGESRDFDSEL